MEIEERASNLKISFEDYLTLKAPFSDEFKAAVLVFYVWQIASIGIQINGSELWTDNNSKVSKGLEILLIPSLALSFENENTILHWSIFITTLVVVELIFYIICRLVFKSKNRIQKVWLNIYRYYSTIIHIYVFPAFCSCLGYLVNIISKNNLDNSFHIFLNYLAISIFITRNAIFVFEANAKIYFKASLFNTIKQHHFIVCLANFIIAFNSKGEMPLLFQNIFISFLSLAMLLIEFSSFYWLKIREGIVMRTVLSGNFAVSLVLLADSIIESEVDIKNRKLNTTKLWITFISTYFIFSMIYLAVSRISIYRSMKRLDDQNYSLNTKPETAMKDHIICLIEGHPAVLSSIHLNLLLKRYPNNLDLQVLSSQLSLFLRNVENIGINYQSKFYPLWGNYLKSLNNLTSFDNSEQTFYDKSEAEMLLNQFLILVQSIIIIYQLLLDENMATVRPAIIDFAHHRDKTIKLLVAFLQGDNNMEDKRFFFKLFITILPSHQEIQSLMCTNHNFYRECLSFFPGNIKYAISQPELFKDRNGYKVKHVSESVVERAREIISEYGRNPAAGHSFTLNKVVTNMVITVCIVLMSLPVIVMFLEYKRSTNNILSNSSADFGQDIAIHCVDMIIQMTPQILYASESDHQFWTAFPYETLYKMNIITTKESQDLIAEFTFGLPSNKKTEHQRVIRAFKGNLSRVDYYPLLGGDFTLFYAAQMLGLFSNSLVVNDTSLIPKSKIGRSDYFFEYIRYTFQVIENIILAAREARTNPNLNLLGISFLCFFMIVGTVFLCYYIYTEEKRVIWFLESLRETSKSELVRARNFMKELGGNVGSMTMERENRENNTLSFYPILILILPIIGFIVAFLITRHCIMLTIKSHTLYQDTSTDIHIEMGKDIFEKVGKKSSRLFYINTSSLVASRHNSFCTPCYMHDTLSHQFNSSLFQKKSLYISTISHINAFTSYMSLNSTTGLDTIYMYLSEVKKVMSYIRQSVIERNSIHSDNLEVIVFGLAVSYIVVIILIALYAFIRVSKIWNIEESTLEALSVLDYGAIPKESLDILNGNIFNFKSSNKSASINDNLYDRILQANPNAIFVVSPVIRQRLLLPETTQERRSLGRARIKSRRNLW